MSGPSVKIPADWLDADHIEDLGADVVMLMITALGHSARQTTNGLVQRRRLRKLWPVDDVEKAIELLVDAGELEDQGDKVLFVNWADFILEADEVDRIKALNRERAERSRRHHKGDHSICRPSYCREAARLRDASRDQSRDDHVTVRVSNGDPYRPDPDRPLGREGKGRAAAGRRSARAPLPPDATAPRRGTTPFDLGITPTVTVLTPSTS